MRSQLSKTRKEAYSCRSACAEELEEWSRQDNGAFVGVDCSALKHGSCNKLQKIMLQRKQYRNKSLSRRHRRSPLGRWPCDIWL